MSRQQIIYECEICSAYHPWDWQGDCRDDTNRFASPEEYAESLGLQSTQIDIRSMDDRVAADEQS